MAIAPKFAGAKLRLSNSPAANLHTVELYLDYVCPFSAKQFLTFHSAYTNGVFDKRPYSKNVQFIFRTQVQPWHPSSTLVHESAIAVLKLDPDSFWQYSKALMEAQKEYFDVNVVNETRNKTYERLAKLGESVGVKGMYDLLKVGDKPDKDGSLNIGNQVTDDLKPLVKEARTRGIHVSPTVVFNGVPEPSISSSFTKEDWDKWLEKNCS